VNFDPRHMIDTTSDTLSDDTVPELLYEMLNERAEITIRPHFNIDQCFADTCEQIYLWLKDNPGEPFYFLVDEVRFLENPEANQYFDYIVRCLPSKSVSVALTCHGVTDISTDLRRIADYWLLFKLTLEADLIRVRERCGDQVAEEVQKLNPYEYVVWNDSIGEWRKHSEPAKWFVDLKPRMILQP
jgi:hypothetical protein